MKLILAIVSNDDAHSVTNALNKADFIVTRLSTTGGFLRAGNTTLIIGTEDELVDKCIDVIGEESKRRTEIVPSTASYDIGRYASFPIEVQVGGATIFVMDVEKFLKV
mgnify:CR=1 FL=1|jgi:uncharacterized protein YaaQ